MIGTWPRDGIVRRNLTYARSACSSHSAPMSARPLFEFLGEGRKSRTKRAANCLDLNQVQPCFTPFPLADDGLRRAQSTSELHLSHACRLPGFPQELDENSMLRSGYGLFHPYSSWLLRMLKSVIE